MKRLFKCLSNKFFEVPDGTLVNPFLNPKDIMSTLPWDTLDGISIAAGQVNPRVVSEIHVHPFISQITVLLSGSLIIRMKDPCTSDPYYEKELKLPDVEEKGGFSTVAILGSPGTFFQLDNSQGNQPVHVLYICSPSYIYEPGAYDKKRKSRQNLSTIVARQGKARKSNINFLQETSTPVNFPLMNPELIYY